MIKFSIWNSGTSAFARNTTGDKIVANYWHDVAFVFDGSQATDLTKLVIYTDGINTTTLDTAGMPSSLSDVGNAICVLNNVGLNRAWNGRLGFMAIIPDVALTQSQIQSIIEIRSLEQYTAANQPTIQTPGAFGCPQYDFDGVADPNSDHLLTYQLYPLLTSAGSVLCWASFDDITTYGTIWDAGVGGAGGPRLSALFSGHVAGDPIEIYHLDATPGTVFQGRFGTNVISPTGVFAAITSDGSVLRSYVNGVSASMTTITGVNTGQWFTTPTGATVFALAAQKRATLASQLNGKQSKLLIYDRALSGIEIAQIQNRGMGPNGPRWYPQS